MKDNQLETPAGFNVLRISLYLFSKHCIFVQLDNIAVCLSINTCQRLFHSTFCVLHQNGRLSKELDLVSHHVRTRLDELKRQEVSRLRMLLKAKMDSTNIQSESPG